MSKLARILIKMDDDELMDLITSIHLCSNNLPKEIWAYIYNHVVGGVYDELSRRNY